MTGKSYKNMFLNKSKINHGKNLYIIYSIYYNFDNIHVVTVNQLCVLNTELFYDLIS